MKTRMKVLPSIAALAAAILLLAGCAGPRGPGATAAARTATETVKVQRGTLQVKVSGSGTVEPEDSANLSFGTSGTIQQVRVKEGATVKQGDVLATLDPRDLQQEVLQSEASLQTAKAKLEQAKSGNAREEDIRAAQAKVDQAVAQLEKTKKGRSVS
jgi:multidrug efflux pump subunit AcrA (membrane-fusion protein)